MSNVKLLGSTTKRGKTYTASFEEITGLKELIDFGLDDSFYGGRVKAIGVCNDETLLCLEWTSNGYKVINILEVED